MAVSKATALVSFIICVLILATHMVELINLGNWMVIGLISVALIVGGSLYERFGLSFFSAKG